MSPILAANDLLVLRNGAVALEIESLELEEGEVLAVIGPNGAGKSTLLLILTRLVHLNQGQVFFRNLSINELDDLAYRRKIALVLQDPLLMDRSVLENVVAGLLFRGLPRGDVQTRADEWLERLGISHLKDRPARQLSGGEAQRVSLARALVLQPDILFLDEPFSALDAVARSRLIEDLRQLLEETHRTTVFVTHDRDEAMILGDRVAVLLGGHLRQIGTPEQVFAGPVDEEVAAFVGVETVIPGMVVDSREGQLIIQTPSQRLEAVGDLEVWRHVFFCLRPEDVTIWSKEDYRPSSARNHLSGKIVRLAPQGALVRLVMDCGFPLVALVTRASVEEMGLAEGKEVIASFKASAVHLIPR